MSTPALVEAYARQLKEVVRERQPGRETQIVKLADLLLAACQTWRDGIVTVRRKP